MRTLVLSTGLTVAVLMGAALPTTALAQNWGQFWAGSQGQPWFLGDIKVHSGASSSIKEKRSTAACAGSKIGGGTFACQSSSGFTFNSKSNDKNDHQTSQLFNNQETSAFGQGSKFAVTDAFAAATAAGNDGEPQSSACKGTVTGFGGLKCASGASNKGGKVTSFAGFFAD